MGLQVVKSYRGIGPVSRVDPRLHHRLGQVVLHQSGCSLTLDETMMHRCEITRPLVIMQRLGHGIEHLPNISHDSVVLYGVRVGDIDKLLDAWKCDVFARLEIEEVRIPLSKIFESGNDMDRSVYL